jgi:ABC-type antimicrobial peptide transport system permease subunit
MWTDNVATFVNLSPAPRRIVGVVADIDDEKVDPQGVMTVYHPIEQEFQGGRVFVRTTNPDPYALVPAIDKAISEISGQRVERAATLDDIRIEALTSERLNTIVFGAIAAVALVISIVGIGAVLAFSVSGRTREFGVRLAIGSPRGGLLMKVLGEGTVMAVVGVVAGLGVGWALTRAIAVYAPGLQLPGVLPLAGAIALLVVATIAAALVPAARAASIDPIVALRSE